jgi:hypothetical protein
MRHIFLCLLLLTLFVPGHAIAEGGRAFPPDGCSGTNPFMAFDGVATGGNTYCINGQSVLNNALPGCNANQQVIYDGTTFICQDTALNVPTCGSGQFLTYNGTSFSCGSTNVPTCAANYVLTYNGSAFVCVPKSASIPTCAANQFLTYNGTSFQCAATQSLAIPTCATGEVLTGSGGNLACVAAASGGSACSQVGAGAALYNGTHTAGDCACAGGLVTSIGASGSLCQFSGTFCPTGWTRLRQWGTAQSSMCTSGYFSCTANGHSWADRAPQTCTTVATDDGASVSCTAYVTSVGCY